MDLAKEKPSACDAGREKNYHEKRSENSTPAAVVLENFPCWFTLWRFQHGHLSSAGVIDTFKSHPRWLE